MKCFFIVLIGFLAFVSPLAAQVKPDTALATDSSKKTVLIPADSYKALLDSNLFVRATSTPVTLPVTSKSNSGSFFFYLLAALLLFLGLMRTFFSRYFTNMFRVFFNTSLRQSQLTDQLEQAKLPSLLFNLLFLVSAGLYIYVMLRHFSAAKAGHGITVMIRCIAAVGICYAVKFLAMSFTGWVSGYKSEAATYIFIVFLLNKVVGIALLPFTILIIFGLPGWAAGAVFTSLIVLALILLMRFFRSWSLLQNRLKVTRFHFFLYILAVEILPITLIYKGVMLFIGKSS